MSGVFPEDAIDDDLEEKPRRTKADIQADAALLRQVEPLPGSIPQNVPEDAKELARLRGQSQFFQSPTGRRIEYQILGRCAPEDPWLFYIAGMTMHGMPSQISTIFMTRESGIDKRSHGEADLPFRVVALSRPGYGRSTLNIPAGKWSYADFVADLDALAEHLGANDIGVWGTSSGGPNCLAAAALCRKVRIAGVLLLSCDANYGPSFPRGTKMFTSTAAGAAARSYNGQKALAKVSSKYNYQDEEKEAIVSYVDGMSFVRMDGICGACCCAGWCCQILCRCPRGIRVDTVVEKKDLDFGLAEVQAPVMLVHGDKDDTCDANCMFFHARGLPNVVRTQLVPGMGHCVMPQKLFDELMLDFAQLLILEKRKGATNPIRAVLDAPQQEFFSASAK
ncbi:unnamed protein product [Amoebophrya sp. A25]|nr:unnamed protein product [Amoebophrya sp. A25]|eukprot:GSA25T00004354001.1